MEGYVMEEGRQRRRTGLEDVYMYLSLGLAAGLPPSSASAVG